LPLDDHAVLVIFRAGTWLAAQGVRAGDVVALCAPESRDLALTRYAISSVGAMPVTLSPTSSRRDLCAQLCGSGARWLITTRDLFVQKLEVAARPTAVMHAFLIGSAAGDATAPGGLRFAVSATYGEAAATDDDLRV
jgi:acyl-CoA synthetase (AMP-forming)/AMP-acid ligase II